MQLRWPLFVILCCSLLVVNGQAGAEQESAQDNGQDAEASVQEEVVELPRVAVQGRNLQAISRLRQEYPEQFVELDAHNDSYTALFLPANSHQPLGRMVMVPGLQQPADAPGIIAMLRSSVTDKSWHSLVLHLPDLPFAALQISAAPDPQAGELAPDQLSDDVLLPKHEPQEAAAEQEAPAAEEAQQEQQEPQEHQEKAAQAAEQAFVRQVARQLELALSRAMPEGQQGGQLLLLQNGSAAVVLQLLQSQPELADRLDHLLLLNPQDDELAESTLVQLIEASTLDITEFNSAAGQVRQQQAEQRKRAGQRKRQGSYRQIRLDPYQADQAAQANRRIVGWLYKYNQQFQ